MRIDLSTRINMRSANSEAIALFVLRGIPISLAERQRRHYVDDHHRQRLCQAPVAERPVALPPVSRRSATNDRPSPITGGIARAVDRTHEEARELIAESLELRRKSRELLVRIRQERADAK